MGGPDPDIQMFGDTVSVVGCPLSAQVGHIFFCLDEPGPDTDGDTTQGPPQPRATRTQTGNKRRQAGSASLCFHSLRHCTGSLLSSAAWLTTGKHCLFFPGSGPSFRLAGQVLATLTTMVPSLLPQSVQSRSFTRDQVLLKPLPCQFCSTLSSA